MAELAQQSGLSVPTIKFYLREGLLPHGTPTGATRATYGEGHVRRLRLIRALTEVAGLRLETVRQVLEGIDRATSWHDAVGSAHTRLAGASASAAPPRPESLARVDALLERQGWELGPEHPQAAIVARTLETLEDLGHPAGDAVLDLYASALGPVAALEVASIKGDDLEASIEGAVIGTLVQEPLILAIRRIAQENASRSLAGSESREPD